jgi:hypothetical protein
MTTNMINTTAMISHATDPTVGSCCGCIGRAYDIIASARKSAPGETEKETVEPDASPEPVRALAMTKRKPRPKIYLRGLRIAVFAMNQTEVRT